MTSFLVELLTHKKSQSNVPKTFKFNIATQILYNLPLSRLDAIKIILLFPYIEICETPFVKLNIYTENFFTFVFLA